MLVMMSCSGVPDDFFLFFLISLVFSFSGFYCRNDHVSMAAFPYLLL